MGAILNFPNTMRCHLCSVCRLQYVPEEINGKQVWKFVKFVTHGTSFSHKEASLILFSHNFLIFNFAMVAWWAFLVFNIYVVFDLDLANAFDSDSVTILPMPDAGCRMPDAGFSQSCQWIYVVFNLANAGFSQASSPEMPHSCHGFYDKRTPEDGLVSL